MRRQLVALGVIVMMIALCGMTAGALTLKTLGERAQDRELSLQTIISEVHAQEALAGRASEGVDGTDVTDALAASLARIEHQLRHAQALGMPAARATALRQQAEQYTAELGQPSQTSPADVTQQDLLDALTAQVGATHAVATKAVRESSLSVLGLGASVLLVFALASLRMRSLERRRRRQREALDQLQRDFISATSHDLRTPLTSILGYGEVLADDDGLDPARRTAASAIVRNAQRLRAISDNLLFLSSSDAGRSDRLHTPVDLKVVVERIGPHIDTTIRSRALYVEYWLPDEPVVVNGDAMDLERVVQNLLGNAVKFTPDGGEILCRLMVDGDRAVLEVHDTGIGVSREEQQHVFTRFFRGQRAKDRALPGTGLGLSIVASVAEDHGGTVAVRSNEGVGSTFTVTLPLSKDRVAAPVAAPVETAPAEPAPA